MIFKNHHKCPNTGRVLFKKGHTINNGRKQSKEDVKKRMVWCKGKPLSEKHKQKLRKPRPMIRGKNHPNWKGGHRSERRFIMDSFEYKLWRTSVFERDNYTCIWCGQRGGTLNADHIKPFAYYPELRFAIDNGRTLCEDCHKTTESYGRGYRG